MQKQLLYCSENGSVNLLARLTLDESYSSIALSEYRGQLISSMEAVGAVLVANGVCSLLKTTIAANISTRTNQSESYNYGKYVTINAFMIILCFYYRYR